MATTESAPPNVEIPDGWERTSSGTETMFDARVVTVRAHTVVLEDARLRETVRDGTGADGTWRFFFASRLTLRPRTRGSKSLTKLVTNRANEGFVSQLRERGFSSVERVENRRFAVGRTEADLTRYRATVEVTTGEGRPVAVSAEGYLAVWPDDDGFLMAGGAYPLAVEDEALRDALSSVLAPDEHRDELFSLIRSTD